jgi:hypothetical protein
MKTSLCAFCESWAGKWKNCENTAAHADNGDPSNSREKEVIK